MEESSYLGLAVTVISLTNLLVGWLMHVRKRKQYEQVGRVSKLVCYPVKSCKGIPLEKANATVLGLKFDDIPDRHWLITRNNGDFLSQRQCPKMALISASNHGNEIQLDAPGMPSFRLPKNPPLEMSKVGSVRVWECKLEALHCGEEAGKWISQFLGIEGLHIGYFAPGLKKRDNSLEEKPWGFVALPGDYSAYADFGAYLVTNEASLESLNQRLTKKVKMENFRPNIVVQGCAPFDEDDWLELRIGDKVFFRVQDPCTRCTLTTVDPDKGEKDPDMEPLKTLKKFRCFPPYAQDGPCFGINVAIDVSGEVKVGDPVYVLRKKKK